MKLKELIELLQYFEEMGYGELPVGDVNLTPIKDGIIERDENGDAICVELLV